MSSRYYDPEVGRFVNADDEEILFVEQGSVNQYNFYAYCLNNPVNRIDENGKLSISIVEKGLGTGVTGLVPIGAGAAVIASGVAAPLMLGIAAITITAGVLTTANGVSDLGEAVTGKNMIKDIVFRGNTKYYNTYSKVTTAVATVGAGVCGGWTAMNQPRIVAYKNVQNYKYTKTISDSVHMKRPYNNSVLIQKQVIKYGKVKKDKFGYVFSAKGSVNGKTKLWRLGINI